MITLLSHKLTRLACMAVLACTAMLVLADVSSAATRKLNGTYSRSQITAACTAAGGMATGGNSPGGYGCISKGSVDCTAEGKCTGTCSKCAAVARGLNGVLQPPASAGTASARGGTTNNKPPLHNVNQPVLVQHSGGARSGGSKH